MSNSHSLHVTAEAVQFYRDHGYFVYQHPLFSAEKFQRLQGFLRRLIG